jgi:MerR family transcriptional regulator, heat shock protein HspR
MVNRKDHQTGPAADHGVFAISVAAELCGAPIHVLRVWERHGLLTPSRSRGGTRRYSVDDISRLHRITALAAAGVNVVGISRILELEDDYAVARGAKAREPRPDGP